MDSINQSILGLEDSYSRNEIQWKVKYETLFFRVLDQLRVKLLVTLTFKSV